MYLLVGLLVRDRYLRLVPMSLVLWAPLYLYWSRTFMIESTAQFLSLAFLWSFWLALRTRRHASFVLALLFGVLAGLTKVTTFVVYLIPAAAMTGSRLWWMVRSRAPWSRVARGVLTSALLVGLPIAATMEWTAYADAVKRRNPFAEGYTSKALSGWTFGTWEQRTSHEAWDQIAEHSCIAKNLGGIVLRNLSTEAFLLAGAVAIAVLYHRVRRWQILLLFASFFAGPLLFTNLYMRHDYYHYATSLFAVGALGIAFVALWESASVAVRFVSVALLPYALMTFLSDYERKYLPYQLDDNRPYRALATAVSSHTTDKDVLLVYNGDWDSTIPYIVGRRSLHDTLALPLDSGAVQRELAELAASEYRIGAMLVTSTFDGAFIRARVEKFGFRAEPTFEGGGLRLYTVR
jgi:hypothetical protein